MKTLVKVCRILVGLLFIFSGFVKADDPLGFTYKLQEYFAKDALNLPWLDPFAFTFSIIIPIVEMVIGLMIIIGTRKKLTLWLLLLTILFFSFLTFYTAYYNKVLECGCFGDAIPMTPWESFGKNMVLLFLILILIVGHNHIKPALPRIAESALVFLFTLASLAFSIYCYNYLPVIDFRPYKPGTDIKKGMQGVPDVLKYYYTLKNKKTGATQEFTQFPPNYQNDWDYVSNRTEVIKKGIEPKIKDFSITNVVTSNDVTDSVLSIPNYNFLLVSLSLTDANKNPETIKKINDLATECLKNHIGFICLTAEDDAIQKYSNDYHPPYSFYITDGTVLKTIIRSNPGLILIKKGVIIADWHYHSIPDYNTVNQKYHLNQ